MSLILNESLVLAKTRSQDLKSVLKLNCWGSGIKDVSLVRQLINVEIIGLSCNEISSLEDFSHCKKLKELILRGNKIKNISEISHLQKLPALTSLWLQDNPCVESTYNYRKVVLKALPQLKTLDNKPVTREELQEIEELGDEIYEEVPYESSSSHSSGPQSHNNSQARQQANQAAVDHDNNGQINLVEQQQQPQSQYQEVQQPQSMAANVSFCEQSLNDVSLYQPTHEVINESISGTNNPCHNESTAMLQMNRSSRIMQPRLSSQGSMNALNGNQWPIGSNNNNNLNNSNMNILPKGGKSRSANILSAVLCLVKELDYVGCEVVQTALNCRMEETQ